ncbi:MAG: branched-chain amino acid ABC transporter substrate-binding protein, partial [Actinomycetota bacterium]|nr:branched-chain amino acid ABC transporter substrate-binding protein [Actinomycetota bacterium]
GVSAAAAIHDGDPYTQGLAQAFADAFEGLGGTVTGFTGVNKEDTDMVPVLTEIAAGSPGALFFPIFQPAGDMVADQAPGVSGLEGTILLGADGLQVQSFMELAQADGMYLSGPDLRYGDNTNQSTGVTATQFLADYESNNGNAPEAPFWAHSYDATTILLEAIKAASHVDGDDLVIDRAGVREYLDNLSGYEGIIGTLSCDAFGDCGAARITVVQNNSADFQGSLENVVFEFAP